MITGTVIFINWGPVCSRRAQLYEAPGDFHRAVPRAVGRGELMKRALTAGNKAHSVQGRAARCILLLLALSEQPCSPGARFQGLHRGTGSLWQHCQRVPPLPRSPLLAQRATSWAAHPVFQFCYLSLKTNDAFQSPEGSSYHFIGGPS